MTADRWLLGSRLALMGGSCISPGLDVARAAATHIGHMRRAATLTVKRLRSHCWFCSTIGDLRCSLRSTRAQG